MGKQGKKLSEKHCGTLTPFSPPCRLSATPAGTYPPPLTTFHPPLTSLISPVRRSFQSPSFVAYPTVSSLPFTTALPPLFTTSSPSSSVCFVLFFVYIYCKRISGLDKTYFRTRHTKTAQVRTFSAPSPHHLRSKAAPFSLRFRTVNARESRFIYVKYAEKPYPHPTKTGALVPA